MAILSEFEKRKTLNGIAQTEIGQAKSLIKQCDSCAAATCMRVGLRNSFVLLRCRERNTCKLVNAMLTYALQLAAMQALRSITTQSLPSSGLKKEADFLATRKELSEFLASVERRAYKQALFAARDEQVALDAVQDAMFKLSEKYSGRPSAELPMLFQRILQNTIRDHFRRQKVRAMWTTPISSLAGGDDSENHDPLETLESENDSNLPEAPPDQLQQSQTLEIIEKALERLPARQRQAFLLRYWEEMDVAEAAAAMGCSPGSVKTHCSRAAHALAAYLKDKGISL